MASGGGYGIYFIITSITTKNYKTKTTILLHYAHLILGTYEPRDNLATDSNELRKFDLHRDRICPVIPGVIILSIC